MSFKDWISGLIDGKSLILEIRGFSDSTILVMATGPFKDVGLVNILVNDKDMIKWGIFSDKWLENQELDDFIQGLQLESSKRNNIYNLLVGKDRQRRSFGYYLVQKCLQYYTGTVCRDWKISDKGKPYQDGISFNISHDYKYVVLVARRGEFLLGVDVCWIDTRIQVEEFKDYLQERELCWINRLREPKLGFYMIWALKEATSKGIGDGMGFGFKRLEFIILENEPFSVLGKNVIGIIGFMDNLKMDWNFSIQFLDSEHLVAIASSTGFNVESGFEIRNCSLLQELGGKFTMISDGSRSSGSSTCNNDFKVIQVSNKSEWEQAYSIRLKVFVQEQKVPQENELDELDPQCIHWILVSKDKEAVGTLRLYINEENGIKKGKLGRMAVLKEYRRLGLGKMLIQALVEYARIEKVYKIVCHSQEYVQDFYKSCGFKVDSETVFMEEGIPHVLMSQIIQD